MTMRTASVSERKSSRQPSKSAPRRIGYARVSTKAQDLERQIRALKAERVDEIFKEIIDADATIRVLDRSYIDLASPIGRGFMAFISAMAEDERQRIIKRTHEGRVIARENGVKMGRKFRLNEVQRSEARHRLVFHT